MQPVLIGTVVIEGEEIDVYRSKYMDNGSLALMMYSKLLEPYATLSTNLSDDRMRELGENEFYFKDYDNMPYYIDLCVKADLMEYVEGKGVLSGHGVFRVAKLK